PGLGIARLCWRLLETRCHMAPLRASALFYAYCLLHWYHTILHVLHLILLFGVAALLLEVQPADALRYAGSSPSYLSRAPAVPSHVRKHRPAPTDRAGSPGPSPAASSSSA